MSEEGYFALQLETLVVNLTSPIASDATWKIDIAIEGTYNVFQWIPANDPKFSIGTFKPVQQEGLENSYIFGFNGQFLRSNFIELNSETINGLSNASITLRLFSINESAGSSAPAKGKKGANDPVVPAEEILMQLSIPMANLFAVSGCDISIQDPIEQYMSGDSVVTVSPVHSTVLPSSTFTLRAFTDSDLAAYVLGSKILRWRGAALSSPPPSWALHAADVVDPKAKVQPTAADLRAKYLENIAKLVETQAKVATYSFEIGSNKESVPSEEEGGGGEGDNSTADLILKSFPPLILSGGKIACDIEAAKEIPVEEDIRARADIWSVSWQQSPCIFFHRSQAKKLVQLIAQDTQHAYLPLTVKKTPFPEYTAAEGGEVFATGLVDISPIITPGKAIVDLVVGSLVGDQMEDYPVSLQLTFASNEPLKPISELSKLASAPIDVPLPKSKIPQPGNNRDALQELRDEISLVIERIAQEYVSQYPTSSNQDAVEEDKKNAFLTYLVSQGIFHNLQEKIRPKVLLLVEERYGVRGRALGKSEVMKKMDADSDQDYNKAVQSILSELYVFLLKECNTVLNSMFNKTMIQKQRNEVNNPARLDDEEESNLQKLYRLYRQALDRAADGRNAEDLYLERLQMIDHNLTLYNDKKLVHAVYFQYAEYLLSQATKDIENYWKHLKKAREVLQVSVQNSPPWTTLLLYATVQVECDQPEAAEQTLHTILKEQLVAYSMGAFDDMAGYDTDSLCPISPRVYCVLASLFSMQKKSLLCNKALRLANRCYLEGEERNDSHLGSPRRSLVLILSETTLYLLQYGQYQLARSCLSLAQEAEAAVQEKARIKNKPAPCPPHVRYLLIRAQVEASGGFFPVYTGDECVDKSKECALVAQDPADQITAHLCAANASLRNGDLETSVEHFLLAVSISREKFNIPALKKLSLLPLTDLLTLSKVLQQYGRYTEANSILLYSSQLYSSASLCLQLGVNYMRLEKVKEAEQALQEANLLDNSNPEIWAMLSILCVQIGPHRVYEAEQCLFQTLRLGLSSPSVLRELARSFMSVDKLQVAEDLLRRSIAAELAGRGYANPHTRKLLADVLAGQNLAAKAVEEYRGVLGDEQADAPTKRAAADKCLALLAILGRDEELEAVKGIIAALDGARDFSAEQ